MSDKYLHQSNYVYCSNNPIEVIVPNGEDEWVLNIPSKMANHNKVWSRTDSQTKSVFFSVAGLLQVFTRILLNPIIINKK